MKSTAEPVIETRSIATRDGTLVIEMTQTFIDRVKRQFNLDRAAVLTDDHLKLYLWGAVNNAVNKAAVGLPDVR